jgi:hypothetical protein
MEVASMTSLLRHSRAAAQLIIAIARMFGKAVKLRHCPATVSAPVSFAVVYRGIGINRISAGASATQRNPLEATAVESILIRLWEGG